MELKEILALKEQHEKENLLILKSFEDQTGLRVTGVEVYRVGEMFGVKIRVDL